MSHKIDHFLQHLALIKYFYGIVPVSPRNLLLLLPRLSSIELLSPHLTMEDIVLIDLRYQLAAAILCARPWTLET